MGSERIELLLKLAELGAIGEKKEVTLRELASVLKTSPQSVLRLIRDLEREGLVSRGSSGRKTRLELTEKGLELLERLHERLERALYQGLILGEVVSGLGEGSYYVQLYKDRIKEYLGFEPFPGTLNVRVIFPKTVFDALADVRPILIPGFVRDGRTFGDVKAYPVRVEGIEGAIVVPSRTVHPPKIAEIIAPVNLRETLRLKDGSRIRIQALRS
ncbi:MAG: CTP-dependent riboflavin kinase [Thermococcus sp.]|nr:CTP-dependent riboflavin kinase [Thermococcus sp.]